MLEKSGDFPPNGESIGLSVKIVLGAGGQTGKMKERVPSITAALWESCPFRRAIEEINHDRR